MTTLRAFHTLCFMLITGLILGAGSLHAQSLSDRQITGFIAAMEDLQTLEDNNEFDQIDIEEAADGEMPDFSSLMSDGVAQMRGHDVYDKVEAVVRKHGFDSNEDWARVGDRVFQAFMAHQMNARGQEMQKMQGEMARAMQELENNPNLSREQKDQMKAMMGGAASSMQSMANAPEEDVEAIRPHLDRLNQALEVEE